MQKLGIIKPIDYQQTRKTWGKLTYNDNPFGSKISGRKLIAACAKTKMIMNLTLLSVLLRNKYLDRSVSSRTKGVTCFGVIWFGYRVGGLEKPWPDPSPRRQSDPYVMDATTVSSLPSDCSRQTAASVLSQALLMIGSKLS